MYALIKREIRDHRIFFLGAVVLTASLIGLSVTALYNNRQIDAAVFGSGGGVTALVIVVFGLFAMGSVQMYTDKTRKISAFVSTLPVSRSRVLLAKICAGVLVILTAIVPLAVAVAILLPIKAPPVPMYWVIARDVFASTFLTVFACYCIGLQVGWNSGKVAPALGGLALTCILASLIIIKGLAPEMMIMLSIFIVASLIRIWHNFTSSSL